MRRSLDLTSWEAASELIAQWHAAGEIGGLRVEIPTVREAIEKYFADCRARDIKDVTIKKLKILLERRLLEFCKAHGYRQLKQLDVDALRAFRATWPDSPLSAFKNMERLRSFFYFCVTAGWIKDNPAKSVKMPKLAPATDRVKVFTKVQLEKIIAACEKYPQRNAYGHDNVARMKAFILTLRYTGLRIGDCVGLKKVHLEGDRIFLRTQKSGTPVFVPVPKVVVDSLKKIENGSDYFFWTGNGMRKSAVADWQRALRNLFEIAEVDGHAHMFRHSLATELLSKGVPTETVATILGHRSPEITNSYYSHWVKARQDALETAVRSVW